MSDGNFNRNLLPPTLYRSGYRAGSSQMRVKAEKMFATLLRQLNPNLSESEAKQWIAQFHHGLEAHE